MNRWEGSDWPTTGFSLGPWPSIWYAGEQVWATMGEPSEGQPEKLYILIQETEESVEEIVAEADYPGTVSYTFTSHRRIHALWFYVAWPIEGKPPKATIIDVGCRSAGEQQPFPINLGVGDAWYDSELDGHGVLITVFPSIRSVFLALFTFDVTRPEPTPGRSFGDAGHRWMTAFGPYAADRAEMTIDMTVGGVFLDPNTEPIWYRDGDMHLQLKSCNQIHLEYEIPSIGRTGVLTLRRVTDDRVKLCERYLVAQDD